jgi:hypothetical protein
VEQDTGKLETKPSDLLVFVDETGHEEIERAGHRLFGLGGCAIQAGEYDSVIRGPWRAMRDEFLGDPDASLHAHALRELGLSPSGQEALVSTIGQFFRDGAFHRFAAVATVRTRLEDWIWVHDQVHIGMMARLVEVVGRVPRIDRVLLVYEASERLARVRRELFQRQQSIRLGAREVLIAPGEMSKTTAEPGLEVADFVMHAAQAQVRSTDSLSGATARKDFLAVFQDVSPDLVSFRALQNISTDRESYQRTGGAWSRTDDAP